MLRRIFALLQRRGPPGPPVLVENKVELKGCTFIGENQFGLRSYANDSLFRDAIVGRYSSIGRRCSVGAGKHHITGLTSHPYGDAGRQAVNKTIVGNDVWIGDNVVIMAGVTIGHGAVIGAGTILTRDVPPYAIVVGVPGKVVRRRFDDATITRLLAVSWWKYGDAAVEASRYRTLDETLDYFQDAGLTELPIMLDHRPA